MRSTRYLLAAWVLCGVSACTRAAAPVLDKQALLDHQTWWDNRDWDWYKANIPFFESPDTAIDATYYYRWELLTKHLTYGSPESGYNFTEFLDRPFWSGSYGAISCPLGHQFYEARWLHDPRVVTDYARYWFDTPGAQPRSYSNWYGDAMWATYLVLGDTSFLRAVLPHMQAQDAGWVTEHWDSAFGMFRWDGMHDGMETNINSRQTADQFSGAEGYRPTLDSYLFADERAIARAAGVLGDVATARTFGARAEALKARVERELWDPRRTFFLHMFAHDEQGGIKAHSRTYQTGEYAGNPHGREEIGFVPWQFELPDSGYEAAWRYLMDSEYFYASYGPTTVERHDPQFYISPRCCVWSGNSWPYATTQTLEAFANLLNDYRQPYVTKADYLRLLEVYTRTQRWNGRPYIAEAANPDDGSWDGHNSFYHSEHYFHSGYVDLIITGLVGLRPRADDTLEVNPLAPEAWPYFALDDVRYHGHRVSIVWDRDGTRYGRGAGLTLLADGRRLATAPRLERITVSLGPPIVPAASAPMRNLAVNNGRGPYPWVRASYSAPLNPPVYAIDGNYWYHTRPPNRWTTLGSGHAQDWLDLDFGTVRPVEVVKLYFLDDGTAIRAPASYRLEMWQHDAWVDVPGQRRVPAVPQGRRANVVDVGKIATSRLRVVLVHQPGFSSGMTELEAWAHADLPLAPPTEPAHNVAFGAKATASFTAPGDRVGDINDMRVAFTHYARNRWTAYGSPHTSDWVELNLGTQQTIRLVELYLWGDSAGVRAPKRFTIQYWDGAAWANAHVESQTPERPTTWALNAVRITPIATDRVRVVFEHDLPAFSGVTELMLWDDLP
jgi:hypothetical protein